MNVDHVKKHFRRMGTDFCVHTRRARWRRMDSTLFALDVVPHKKGERFVLRVFGDDALSEIEIMTAGVDVKERALVLFVRERGEVRKFLCGYDERHWFVAALPAGTRAGVKAARDALLPVPEARHLPVKERHRRKNSAFIRQGEWFFVPCPELVVPPERILRNELLLRNGTPHIMEFAARSDGIPVYVSPTHPNGLTKSEFRALIKRQPHFKNLRWQPMVRNARVYAKGRISHPHHKTIRLDFWHRVFPNLESSDGVAFLD